MTDFDSIQVAEMILRRDPLYRSLQRGKPPKVYKQLSQLASEALAASLSESVQSAQSSAQQETPQWPLPEARFKELSALLLAKTWKSVLDEPQMKMIAIHVQHHKLGTLGFQKAIEVLFRALFLSNRLKKRPDFASEEAYREAQNILQLWLCQNIYKFDPERGEFIKWLNFRFDRTHIPQATDLNRRKKIGNPVGNFDFDCIPSNEIAAPLNSLSDWIESDYIFRIPNRDKPHITFLDIVLARTQAQTWQDIANEYGFNRLTTPRNFLTNWLNNLMTPLIEDQPQSSLHTIRFARFEGESWSTIAQKFQIEESCLRAYHQQKILRFPSYRDVIRNDRYNLVMPEKSAITFSALAKLLLETGHLWQIPSEVLSADPAELQRFYQENLTILWPPR